MLVKILTSTLTDLETFRLQPFAALNKAEQGIIAVLDNNIPVMYAVTPDRLAQLLHAEAASLQMTSDVALDENLIIEEPMYPHAIPLPAGKFRMYSGWQPDADLLRLAAVWGVALNSAVTAAELASFITYWQAEGRVFHHVQWQQKLARSVQLNRSASHSQTKRDINHVSEPDPSIPDGFRG